MRFFEVNPLPEECLACKEQICDECDYAGFRRALPREEELRIKRIGIKKAIARMEKQLEILDLELSLLHSQRNDGNS